MERRAKGPVLQEPGTSDVTGLVPSRGRMSPLQSASELSGSTDRAHFPMEIHECLSVEELQKDPDSTPYFNFKLVLVVEGALRVGYIEFMPPSMLG